MANATFETMSNLYTLIRELDTIKEGSNPLISTIELLSKDSTLVDSLISKEDQNAIVMMIRGNIANSFNKMMNEVNNVVNKYEVITDQDEAFILLEEDIKNNSHLFEEK